MDCSETFFLFQGFEGDGFICRPSVLCYENPDMCDPNADCLAEHQGRKCTCRQGYSGDGFSCEGTNTGTMNKKIKKLYVH